VLTDIQQILKGQENKHRKNNMRTASLINAEYIKHKVMPPDENIDVKFSRGNH